jgi:hypothetical protein
VCRTNKRDRAVKAPVRTLGAAGWLFLASRRVAGGPGRECRAWKRPIPMGWPGLHGTVRPSSASSTNASRGARRPACAEMTGPPRFLGAPLPTCRAHTTPPARLRLAMTPCPPRFGAFQPDRLNPRASPTSTSATRHGAVCRSLFQTRVELPCDSLDQVRSASTRGGHEDHCGAAARWAPIPRFRVSQ